MTTSITGARVEEFCETEQLGAGGSATVHRAVHGTFGGVFALKRWRTGLSDDQRRKFMDECSLQWRLSEHPNIVRLYWAGAAAQEAPWLAMELFECSLADRLDGPTALSLPEALSVAEDLLAGLSAVHEAQHVHRDVKPANVLLKQGRAALSDFGIAKHIEGWTSDPVAGSAGFIAPEVSRGQEPTYRSDVYAAGVTIAAAVGAQAPDWLDDILVQARSFDPQDRPADASALLAALQAGRNAAASAADVPVAIATNGRAPTSGNGPDADIARRPRRSRRPHRRRGQLLISAIAVAALLITAGVVRLSRREDPPADKHLEAAVAASPTVVVGADATASASTGLSTPASPTGTSGPAASPGNDRPGVRQTIIANPSHTTKPTIRASRVPTTRAPSNDREDDSSAAVGWESCTASPGRCSGGQRMTAGQELATGNYVLQLQQDGNLVVYAPGHQAIWSTDTSGDGVTLEMQQDGNLVLYASGHQAIWSTDTTGSGVDLELQEDGNLVLYKRGHQAIWSSGTA